MRDQLKQEIENIRKAIANLKGMLLNQLGNPVELQSQIDVVSNELYLFELKLKAFDA